MYWIRVLIIVSALFAVGSAAIAQEGPSEESSRLVQDPTPVAEPLPVETLPPSGPPERQSEPPLLPTSVPTARPNLVPPATSLPSTAPAQTGLGSDAVRLDQQAADVDDAARLENWDRARRAWASFEDRWLDVEDGFRAVSRDAYRDIELAMRRVGDALGAPTPDGAIVRRELMLLRDLFRPFVATAAPTPAPRVGPSAPSQAPVYPSPTARLVPPTATPVPESCTTPSLTISPTSLRSDGFIDWRARGFKPGTVVAVAVYGPTQAGSISGPFVKSFEHQTVDRNCGATSDEGIKAEELFEDNPTLPPGHYVLVVTGIRWAPPSSPESDLRVQAPFNYYVVRR